MKLGSQGIFHRRSFLKGVTGAAGAGLAGMTLLRAEAQADSRGRFPAIRLPHPDNVVLAFTTLVGVDGALVDSDAIRGVKGDELPWEVGEASGFLTTEGRLHISVRGLVFPSDDPSVPEDLRGINDESHFRGLVSVLDEDGAVQNLATDPFPASRRGNSEINAKVTLPNYSFAPIIFILAGSEEKWFAVTGVEASNGE